MFEMDKEKKRLARHMSNRLKSHIIRHLSVIMVAAALTIAALAYVFVSGVISEMTDNFSTLVIDRTTQNLDQNFVTLASLMNSVYNYEVITDDLPNAGASSDYEQLVLNRKISEVLRNILHFRKDFHSVSIHALKSGYSYHYSRYLGYVYGPGVDSPEIGQLRALSDERYNDRMVALKTSPDSYTVFKAVKGNNMRTTIAIICIEVDDSMLWDLSDGVNRINSGALVIFDSSRDIIFQQSGDISMSFTGMRTDGKDIVELDSKKYLSKTRNLISVDWQVVYLIPLDELNSGRRFVVAVAGLSTILFLLLGGAVSVRLANRVTRPLQILTTQLKRIATGDFSPVVFDTPLIDEVDEMAVGINSMCEKINELIEAEYKSQIMAKDAQLNTLIAQINPHFLYNVMENISGVGYMRGIPELGIIIENLTDILRYSIDDKRTLVALSIELEYIKKYVMIQNTRFSGRLVLDIRMPPRLGRLVILKFLLQPIVENAILHGLLAREEGGMVQITADDAGGDLYIVVADNGVGINGDTVRELNAMESVTTSIDSKRRGNHVGINNVHKRIKLYYGATYGIHYESTLGSGTKVTITVPKRSGQLLGGVSCTGS